MSRSYLLAGGRPVAVEVEAETDRALVRAEVGRVYGGRWRVGAWVRRGHRRRASLVQLDAPRRGLDWLEIPAR